MPSEDTIADRAAVVLEVEAGVGDVELHQELLGDRSEVIERILEGGGIGEVGVAEAGIVRRDDMKRCRQLGDQIAKHVRRRREPAQEHEGRVLRVASLTVEDVEPFDHYPAIADGGGVDDDSRVGRGRPWRGVGCSTKRGCGEEMAEHGTLSGEWREGPWSPQRDSEGTASAAAALGVAFIPLGAAWRRIFLLYVAGGGASSSPSAARSPSVSSRQAAQLRIWVTKSA